jgi:hypothetical protein
MIHQSAGAQNTNATLQAAFEVAESRGIRTVVVASTEGQTGIEAAEMGAQRGIGVIVVTHNTGFEQAGEQQLGAEARRRIQAAGARLHTGTLVLRGVGSAIRKKFGGSQEELIAAVLRLFGQGMKVCVEMAAMVADAGLVPASEDVVCVAGTAKGADTAALISPAPSNKFFDIKIREVIAKPGDF